MPALKSLSIINSLKSTHYRQPTTSHEAEGTKDEAEGTKVKRNDNNNKEATLQFVARGRLKVNCCRTSKNVQFRSKKYFYFIFVEIMNNSFHCDNKYSIVQTIFRNDFFFCFSFVH